jgi:hypothetical protein
VSHNPAEITTVTGVVRLVLPPGEKYMLLEDEDGDVLLEIHEYQVRRDIESGELLNTSRFISAFYDYWKRGIEDGSHQPLVKCKCGQRPCKGHEYTNGVIRLPGFKSREEMKDVDNYIVLFDYPGQPHQEIIQKRGLTPTSWTDNTPSVRS